MIMKDITNRIKLIAFDLDGVLVDAKNIHYDALNDSLDAVYKITWSEHLSLYDGLKTGQKLEMLTEQKGLPVSLHDSIWESKQKLTLEKLKNVIPNDVLTECFKRLTDDGYKIAVCSNSIRKTVLTVLSKLDIIEYVDLIISNQDVVNSKPHPEMYWKAISQLKCLPEETLIVEDSPHGLLAASRTKSNIIRVKSPDDVTYELISSYINKIQMVKQTNTPKWSDGKLNVLIPMAGEGSRFANAGYTFPKPLIDVNGKPMIQLVTENLNIDANFIYVVRKSHREKYNLDTLLNVISPNCKIVEVDSLTEGAACTALLAKEFIDNDQPLFFANSDQVVEWDSNEFFYKMNETDADGGIVTFESLHPKWSFAKINDQGIVTEVAEKNPISSNATVGFYYWKRGSDFVKYAEEMIRKNDRVNGEFYICPIFNHAIEDNKVIRTYTAHKMWGIGDPESLDIYLKTHTN